MDTMFQLSRAYEWLRDASKEAADSPFLRLAAIAAILVVAFTAGGSNDAPPPAATLQTAQHASQAPSQAPAGAPPSEAAAPLGFTGASSAEPASTTARSAAPVAMPPPADAEAFDRRLLAWAVLSTPAPGASGKAEALTYLHRDGAAFPGLDLSCDRMSGGQLASCESGVYLAGLDLSPIDGRAAMLAASRFTGADLTDARLTSADLTGAELSQTRLARADLTGVAAPGARFLAAQMPGAMAARGVFDESLFDQSDLTGADFTDASLVRARFVEADLSGATLAGAAVQGADFTGATLAGADFTGVDFSVSTLNGADLSGAVLTDVKNADAAFAENLWAWSDQPPIDAPAVFDVALCAPGADDENRRGHRIARLEGRMLHSRPAGC